MKALDGALAPTWSALDRVTYFTREQVKAQLDAAALLLPGARAIEVSGNRKVGKISVTHAAQGSCPLDCAFLGNGCYAESGMQGMFHTAKMNKRGKGKSPAVIARDEAKAIDGLTGKRLMRLHIVGDCSTDYAAMTVSAAAGRYVRRGGFKASDRRVWTYTHAWRNVRRTSWNRAVSVLASCETEEHIRQARAKGYASAIVVESFDGHTGTYTMPEGERVIPCPAQTREHLPEDRQVTCEQCRLCLDGERLLKAGLSIAFAAHSQGERKAREAIAAQQQGRRVPLATV